MFEVEARARAEELDSARNRLEELGAEHIEDKKQLDKVFGHEKFRDSNNKIVEGGLSARIRKVGDRPPRLDFKEIIRDCGGIEISTELENAEEGEKLLDKLGFVKDFTIDKERELYRYRGFEICLDDVKKLGKFIEVEKELEDDKNKEETMERCKEILERIAPDSQLIKKKYGDMIQERINRNKD